MRYLTGRKVSEDVSSSSSSSSSSSDSLDPVTQFKKMENPSKASGYRGFSTSIAHMFIDDDKEHTDLCSLAMCGVLQQERNRYILSGKLPGHWYIKSITGFGVLLLVAVYLLVQHGNDIICFWIAELILGILFLYGIYMFVFGYAKSRSFRKEVLWTIYQQDGAVQPLHPDDYDGEEVGGHLMENYLQGQTNRDVIRAHNFCSLYKNDVLTDEMDAPPPKHLCGRIWQGFSLMCCGEVGYFLQLCGMCATAQESRELSKIIPAPQRAIDYVTMQPMLSYYSQILHLRQTRNGNIFKHIMATSTLAQHIIYSFLVLLVAVSISCLVFSYPSTYVFIMIATFALSVVTTFILHWPFNKMRISMDAVIKAFGCGFWIASTTALLCEGIVGVLIEGGLYCFYNYFVYPILMRTNFSSRYTAVWDGTSGYYTVSYIHLGTGIDNEFWMQGYQLGYFVYLFFQCFFIAAFLEELLKYLAFRLIMDHPDFWSKDLLEHIVTGTASAKIVDLDSLPKIQPYVQERSLRQRSNAIMVAMVTVALGYACCENLVYLFYYSYGTMDWNFVLTRAILLPIHPICAAWQAIGVCRRDLERDEKFQLGKIILPSIFWHGVFDFAVLGGAYILQNEVVGIELFDNLIAILIPVFVATVSVVLLYWRMKVQQRRFLVIKALNSRDPMRPWTWASAEVAASFDSQVHTTYTYDSESGLEILASVDEIEARSVDDGETWIDKNNLEKDRDLSIPTVLSVPGNNVTNLQEAPDMSASGSNSSLESSSDVGNADTTIDNIDIAKILADAEETTPKSTVCGDPVLLAKQSRSRLEMVLNLVHSELDRSESMLKEDAEKKKKKKEKEKRRKKTKGKKQHSCDSSFSSDEEQDQTDSSV